MDKDMMTIPQRIANLLVSQNINQAELSRRTQIPTSMISRYITGQRKIPVKNLKEIAVALDVPLAYLIGGEGQEPGWVDPDIQYFYEQIFPSLRPEFKSLLRHTMEVLRIHDCSASATLV